MSGGDGRDHNSGAHDSGGGINGGPTGIGGGGPNSGDGWGTTHLPDGRDIHHYDKDKFGGKDKEGKGSSGSSSNPVDLSKNPEAMNTLKTVNMGKPVLAYPVSGSLAITLDVEAIGPKLREALKVIGTFLLNGKVKEGLGISLRGTMIGILAYSLLPKEIGREPPMNIFVKDPALIDKDNPYSITSLPPELVTDVPADQISGKTMVPARVVAQTVIDEQTKTRPVAITPVKSMPVPVVKAQKTDKPNVYTAQVVPGMKPMRIKVNEIKPVKPDQIKLNTAPEIHAYLPAPEESSSHHALIDFGGDHAPVYISVTKEVNPEEAKKQAEQAKKDWAALYPVEAAQEQLDAANKEFGEADKHYRSKLDVLNKLKNTPEGLALSDPAKHPLVYEQNADQRKITKQDISINSRHLVDTLLNEGVKAVWREVMKEELKKPPTVDTAKKAILLSAFYERLSIRLLDVNKKIGPAQKEVNIALESRKKAEGKKKAAEDKVGKEKKRKQPGSATGKGQKVGDKWLHDAGKESGVPIPDRIADKLRGKKFNNFDDFRKQFWEEVSKDPELLKQFGNQNKTNIKNGKAPFARKKDRSGGRERFELHHDKPISEGGGVYDMDNLRVTTPKRHIDIHRGK